MVQLLFERRLAKHPGSEANANDNKAYRQTYIEFMAHGLVIGWVGDDVVLLMIAAQQANLCNLPSKTQKLVLYFDDKTSRHTTSPRCRNCNKAQGGYPSKML